MPRSITSEEFEELYRQTAPDLFSYVRRRTSSDAEDLVAETYAVAWRRRSDLPAPVFRRAWLFGVARRLLVAHEREQRSRRFWPGEGVGSGTAGADAEPTTPESAEKERLAGEVAAALARLRPADREVLQLVGWEGLTPAELAMALGVRPGTARVRLHRARQALGADPAVQRLVARAAPDVPTERAEQAPVPQPVRWVGQEGAVNADA
ncbi:RNA polymerase sigma factor [Nocardioides daejeonensis]|uniref:RNA polymerase sigma factor n=1 Tax=Nocardioides daejeonensis TaxID=1046556 RepID=UPI000D742F29|nr:RNA polymerase sigma factor [Nocardioides daejeonensis]